MSVVSSIDEFPLEYEEPFELILSDTISRYCHHNHTSKHIVSIITSYIFNNEYYFRRDKHIINPISHTCTITIYLYRSKFSRNLFKLICPIRGADFLKYIDNNYIHSNKICAWIDTECKDELFNKSSSANIVNNSYFLMMTYNNNNNNNNNNNHTIPWLVQWKYNNYGPYINVISRIISFPHNWNYVTLSVNKVKHAQCSIIFYTPNEQHTVRFVDDKETISIIKFAQNINVDWLIYGSACASHINYNDIRQLFGNLNSSKLLLNTKLINSKQISSSYLIARSCRNFKEMENEGSFWTELRNYISIIKISDININSYNNCDKDSVCMNVLCQFPFFSSVDTLKYGCNILDVTITNNLSKTFRNKYNIGFNHKLILVLYTIIEYDNNKTSLYISYINVQSKSKSNKIERICDTIIASSSCLTKFLIGRGMYQTIHNDWMLTTMGLDKTQEKELKYKIRLNEELNMVYYKDISGDSYIALQEPTNRYQCRALKYLKSAKKEELQMIKESSREQQFQLVSSIGYLWKILNESKYQLIASTMIGAYIGYRVSKVFKSKWWS